MTTATRIRIVIGLLAGGWVALMASVHAAPAPERYPARPIRLVNPYAPGRLTDVVSRLLARHITEAWGQQVIVDNKGGGNGNIGTALVARAKPDGLTLLGTSGSTQFPYLLGDPRVKYEYKDWKVAMASPTGGVVYGAPGLGIAAPADIAKLSDAPQVNFALAVDTLDLDKLAGLLRYGDAYTGGDDDDIAGLDRQRLNGRIKPDSKGVFLARDAKMQGFHQQGRLGNHRQRC